MNITGIAERIIDQQDPQKLQSGEFRNIFMALLGDASIDSFDGLVPARAEVTGQPRENLPEKKEFKEKQEPVEVRVKEEAPEQRRPQTNEEQASQETAVKEEVKVENRPEEAVSTQQTTSEQAKTLEQNASVENAAEEQIEAKPVVKEVVVAQKELPTTLSAASREAVDETAEQVTKTLLPETAKAQERTRGELLVTKENLPETLEQKIEKLLNQGTEKKSADGPAQQKFENLVEKPRTEVKAAIEPKVELPPEAAPKAVENTAKLTPAQERISQNLGLHTAVANFENHASAKASSVSNGVVTFNDKTDKTALRLADRPELIKRARTQIVANIQKVIDSIAAGKSGNTLTVRLDPPELGKVTVKVTKRSDGLHAKIMPESADVESNLKSRVHELGVLLNLSGVKATNIEIAVTEPESSAEAFSDFLSDQGAEQNQDGGSEYGQGEHQMTQSEEQEILDGWVA